MRTLLLAVAVCALAYGQDNTKGQIVSINPAGPPQAVTALNFYTDGSIVYRCQALSLQPTYTWARTPAVGQATLTSIVVSTNTATATTGAAHGLQVGNQVTVAGAAAAAAALNANYVIATVPSTTTFTFTTVKVDDATYNNATLRIYTTAPRSTAAIWSIKFFQYSGSDLTAEQWAGGSTSMNSVCDDRASLSYQ